MERATAVQFSALARALATEAQRLGLTFPGFRSPPRRAGAARSIRRTASGGAVVSVQLRGRPVDEVAADMVDGVLAANRVTGPDAEALRLSLLGALVGTEGFEPSL